MNIEKESTGSGHADDSNDSWSESPKNDEESPERASATTPLADEEEVAKVNPPPKPKARALQDHPTSEYVFVVLLGMACAFIAGYSNAVCLSGFIHVNSDEVRQSVAGVTGLYTASAIAAGDGDIKTYKFMIGTIFSVMAGSCISSTLNPRPVAFEISPSFGGTFIIGAMFSCLGSVAALQNQRREFYLVAISNGIMNGVSSMYTANLIRTTHLTGTTTDIGLFIGQWLRGNRTNNWKLYILAGLATSFWLGGLVGWEVSYYTRQYSLIVHSLFFFAMGCAVVGYFIVVHKMNLFDAVFGLGKYSTVFEVIVVMRHREGQTDEEVSEEELMSIYDELDSNHCGHVDQDQLVDALSARDFEVKMQRKPLKNIVTSMLKEHDATGDWTVARADWQKLVHHREDGAYTTTNAISSDRTNLSLPIGIFRGDSSISGGDTQQGSRANSFHAISSASQGSRGFLSSIQELRRASIRQNDMIRLQAAIEEEE